MRTHELPAQTGALTLPSAGRAALRAGVIGNYIDNIHMFLPLVALPPALAELAGKDLVDSLTRAAGMGALVMVAMLLGRPVGGVIFGVISDRKGRSRTTRMALWGTVICALGIAALPTYRTLGNLTIVLVIVLRFLGGICIAGEYSAAIPLAMEWAKPRQRGLMSGLILSMAAWAQGSIAFVTALLLSVLGQERYAIWGWRVLFLAGALASTGMILYYRNHVSDSPAFHRQQQRGRERPTRARAVRELLVGRWRVSFWQTFALMSGLWLLTTATVLVLPSQIQASGYLEGSEIAVVMGVASVGQALAMATAGHISTYLGRRRLFAWWGLGALLVAPWLWLATVNSARLGVAMWAAVALQVSTVAAYGPVSAYLSERFPTSVRSTAYGMAYSWSLLLPALYPFYLPLLTPFKGAHAAVIGLLVAGAGLVVAAAAAGPALRRCDTDRDIDAVGAVAPGVEVSG